MLPHKNSNMTKMMRERPRRSPPSQSASSSSSFSIAAKMQTRTNNSNNNNNNYRLLRWIGCSVALLLALFGLHVSSQLRSDDYPASSLLSLSTTHTTRTASTRTTTTTANTRTTSRRINSNTPPTTTTTTSTSSSSSLQVAWLLSFPNSGTTYTWKNYQQLTKTTAATMYGTEFDTMPTAITTTTTTTATEEEPPYFLYAPQLAVPQHYLLVKTHCANYCDECVWDDATQLNYQSFAQGCRTGRPYYYHHQATTMSNTTTTFTQQQQQQQQQQQWEQTTILHSQAPSRFLHLIRHPLDNLVARMHRGIYKRKRYLQWTTQQLSQFNDTRAGFLAWCQYTTTKSTRNHQVRSRFWNHDDDNESSVSSSSIQETMPCYTDLLRYILWHNHALQVMEEAEEYHHVPALHVYYEDYATVSLREATSDDILDFLQQPRHDPIKNTRSLPFDTLTTTKSYSHLFTTKERREVAKLIRTVASKRAWTLLRHYVVDWLRDEDEEEEEENKLRQTSSVEVTSATASSSTTTPTNIAWLMSFPNSGTSYTINNVRRTTNATTATNYAYEALMAANQSVPVQPEQLPDGPFLLLPHMQVPKYILTKTHCTAYCDACQTMDTIRALNQFDEGCRITTRGKFPNLTKIVQPYEPSKAVHIIRSPFDNLVARKHLGSKRRLQTNLFQAEDTVFQDTRDGMVAWCQFIDKEFKTSVYNRGIRPFTVQVEKLFGRVPCFSDWFRYVQWHDLALATVDRLDIPRHFIYYEDYSENYNATVRTLNQFLELETVVDAETFVPGKTYRHVFSYEDVQNARALVKHLASQPLWEKLEHYFDDEQFGIENEDENASEDDEHDVDGWGEEVKDSEETDDDDADPSEDRDEHNEDGNADDDENSVEEEEANQPGRPELVWLLSFPNSGTSYTIMNVMHMSNRTQATNHGMEANESYPIRADLPHGPFILDKEREAGGYTLVKAHCTGYCDVCNQTQSKKHIRSFLAGCVSTKRHENGVYNYHKYSESVVKKLVHVFRSPFDNLVARMHLGIKDRRMAGFPGSLISTFNDTEAGVLSWCKYMDAEFAKSPNASFFSKETNRLMPQVPCHSDLFRYIQWHNLAIELTEQLNIPSMIVHYEDYATSHKKTVDGLLSFMEITPVQEPLDFILGKTYQHLYNPEHARAMALLAKSMATPACWDEVRRYFDEFLSVEERTTLSTTESR